MFNIHVKSKTMLKWAFVLVLIGFAVLLGRVIQSRLRAQEVRVGGPIPYTVKLVETVHSLDGRAGVTSEEIWAIRSDGSRVLRLEHKSAMGTTQRTINFASGIEVTIIERANTKSTVAKPINPARLQRDPASKCMNSLAGEPFTSPPEVYAGEETIAGYRTVKLTDNNNITAWYALDCGCAMVKERFDWGNGFTEKNLVALIPGEPDAALFEVPATAKEVPPSEMLLGSGENRKNLDPATVERLRKLDEYYYKHRPMQ